MSLVEVGYAPVLADIDYPIVGTAGYDTKYYIFICCSNPAPEAFTIDDVEFFLNVSNYEEALSTPTVKVATFEEVSSGTFQISSQDSVWYSISAPADGSDGMKSFSLSSVGLSIASGDYIGVIVQIENPSSGYTLCTITPPGMDGQTSDDYYDMQSSIPTGTFAASSGSPNYAIYGCNLTTGGGVGGAIPYACQTSDDNLEQGDTSTDTWGVLYIDEISSSSNQASIDVTYPWETSGPNTNKIFDTGETETFTNPDDENEKYSITPVVSSSMGIVYSICECWWREEPNGNIYVKQSGVDSALRGHNWDYPVATPSYACSRVSDGGTIYIEAGMYSDTLADIDVASGNSSVALVPVNRTHNLNDEGNVVLCGTDTEGVDTEALLDWYSRMQVSEGAEFRFVFDDTDYPIGVPLQLIDLKIKSDAAGQVMEVCFIQMREIDTGYYTVIHRTDWQRVPETESSAIEDRYGFYMGGIVLQSGDKVVYGQKWVSGSSLVGFLITTDRLVNNHLYYYTNFPNDFPDVVSTKNFAELNNNHGYKVYRKIHYNS